MQEVRFLVKINEDGMSMHLYKRKAKKPHNLNGGPSDCICEPLVVIFNKQGYPRRGYIHAPLTLKEVIDNDYS